MRINSISRSPPCNDNGYKVMKITTRLGSIITYLYHITEDDNYVKRRKNDFTYSGKSIS